MRRGLGAPRSHRIHGPHAMAENDVFSILAALPRIPNISETYPRNPFISPRVGGVLEDSILINCWGRLESTLREPTRFLIERPGDATSVTKLGGREELLSEGEIAGAKDDTRFCIGHCRKVYYSAPN